VFVKIQDRQQYLWRAVDEDGDVIHILVQSRHNRLTALQFFRKLLKSQGREPHRLVTYQLGSYKSAHRATMPSVVHITRQYENNRAEVSHQPTRQGERQMRDFKLSCGGLSCRHSLGSSTGYCHIRLDWASSRKIYWPSAEHGIGSDTKAVTLDVRTDSG